MQSFFRTWLSHFDSKKFTSATQAFAFIVLTLVVYATTQAFGITAITEEMVKEAILAIASLAGVHLAGQSFADAKTGGATSGTVAAKETAFRAGFVDGQKALAEAIKNKAGVDVVPSPAPPPAT